MKKNKIRRYCNNGEDRLFVRWNRPSRGIASENLKKFLLRPSPNPMKHGKPKTKRSPPSREARQTSNLGLDEPKQFLVDISPGHTN